MKEPERKKPIEPRISLCKTCCADCQFIGLDVRPFGKPVTECDGYKLAGGTGKEEQT